MMVIAIAAAEDRKLVTCDVTGAFLEAMMPDDCEVLMSLDATLTSLLCKLDFTANKFIRDDGTLLYVKLRKALYGCVQSSKLWSDTLCSVLTDNGFVVNPYDQCVYNKMSDDGHQVTVCFHVDDLLITSKSVMGIKSLEDCLTKTFSEVTFVRGDNHSYLSMSINRVGQFRKSI